MGAGIIAGLSRRFGKSRAAAGLPEDAPVKGHYEIRSSMVPTSGGTKSGLAAVLPTSSERTDRWLANWKASL